MVAIHGRPIHYRDFRKASRVRHLRDPAIAMQSREEMRRERIRELRARAAKMHIAAARGKA